MKSLEDIINEEVGIALDYLTEFQNSTASDADKKKYQAIEEALAGIDLLYCELQGDVEEDADDIRELIEPFLSKTQLDMGLVETVGVLCSELALYMRVFGILNETEWEGKERMQKALDQADAEIKQKEDDNA